METRAFWLIVVGAAWALVWTGSFAAFFLTGPTGEGFVRGMNRVMAFLGWQGVAAMLSFAVLGVGRGWPPRHPVRRASLVPVILAGLLAAGVAGVVALGRFPV